MDVWQIAPDHIDIYFPPQSQSLNSLWSNPLSSHPIPVPSLSPSPSHSLEPPNNWTSLPPSTSPYHTTYHPLFEIDAFIAQLESGNSGGGQVNAKRVRVGLSGEGREIWGIRISSTPVEEGEEGGEYDWEEGLRNFKGGEDGEEEVEEELQPVDGKRDTYDYDPSEDVGFECASTSDSEEEWGWEVEVIHEDGTITWEPVFNESENATEQSRGGKKNKEVIKKGFLITGAQHAREVRPLPSHPIAISHRLSNSHS